jgi:hypothetical protein
MWQHREVFGNTDLLTLILDSLLPPSQLRALLTGAYDMDAHDMGADLKATEALERAMTLREVSRAFARRTNDVCEEMVASITRGLLLFDTVSQDYIDAHWMGKSTRRYSDADVAEAMHVVEFLYNGAFTWCRLWFTHKSLWSSSPLNDARERVDNLLRARQMFRPKTMHDVYNLLRQRCFVCGCYEERCPATLAFQDHGAMEMVWMQHPYLGEVHCSGPCGTHAHLSGKWLPYTSDLHFCEVIFFLDRRKRRDGTRGPDMLLHVDSEFTPLERQMLKFQKAARQLPNFEAEIVRLFELRPGEVRGLQTRDGSEIFIVHLPLFHLRLGKPEPDSSLASIFGVTDDEVLRLVKKGGRIAREERNLESSVGYLT